MKRPQKNFVSAKQACCFFLYLNRTCLLSTKGSFISSSEKAQISIEGTMAVATTMKWNVHSGAVLSITNYVTQVDK